MTTHTAEQMSERLFTQSVVVMEAASVWLGQRLGLYAALREHGPMASAELAVATSTHPRYVREWLEQQAVAGYLELDGGRFSLPAGHAEALLDTESLLWAEPLVRTALSATLQLPALADAYRAGGGVSWEAFGPDMSRAQGDTNRAVLLHMLPRRWVPQVLELQAQLTAGARVADVACGHGWAAIGLAVEFPAIEVHGYDMDPVAIQAATANATAHGVADRVRFHLGEISGPLAHGPFDVVVAVECLHDMPYPEQVLSAVRRSCSDDAVVLVIDEAADLELTTPGDDTQRLLYGFSVLICLPDSLSHPDSVGTGTVIRPSVVDRYAKAAGFTGATALSVSDTGFWRIYRLGL
ncbi:MAG TPA: methyltransferase domain-containing protein [Nocardioidaceae bacterium]|nr:methyltransferase domain-containing protein [Nocardioidaceae bacterium]